MHARLGELQGWVRCRGGPWVMSRILAIGVGGWSDACLPEWAKGQICTLCDASESAPALWCRVTALTQKRHSGPKCDGRVSEPSPRSKVMPVKQIRALACLERPLG